MATDSKALQWVSILLPTIIAIVMSIITLTNRSTSLNATITEKVFNLEQDVLELKLDIKDLENTKVDVTIFNTLSKKLEDIDKKLDDLRVNNEK